MNIFLKNKRIFSAILFASLCTTAAPSIAIFNPITGMAKYAGDCFVSAKNTFVSVITPKKASTESLSNFLTRQAILMCIISIIPLIKTINQHIEANNLSGSRSQDTEIEKRNKHFGRFCAINIGYLNLLGICNLPGLCKLMPPALTCAIIAAYRNHEKIAKFSKKIYKTIRKKVSDYKEKKKLEQEQKDAKKKFEQEQKDNKKAEEELTAEFKKPQLSRENILKIIEKKENLGILIPNEKASENGQVYDHEILYSMDPKEKGKDKYKCSDICIKVGKNHSILAKVLLKDNIDETLVKELKEKQAKIKYEDVLYFIKHNKKNILLKHLDNLDYNPVEGFCYIFEGQKKYMRDDKVKAVLDFEELTIDKKIQLIKSK